MTIKRTTNGHAQGAQVRVEAKKPVCPQHMTAMKYDPEDTRWHCPLKGCVITSFQKGDHVNGTATKYKGPLSIVVDKRDGKVWLRLAPSTYNGDAMMVLIADDFTLLKSGVDGVAAVEMDSKTFAIAFEDMVSIDHSGRLRR